MNITITGKEVKATDAIKDICKKYLAHGNSVRVVICDVTEMVKKSRKIMWKSRYRSGKCHRQKDLGCQQKNKRF